MRKNYDIRSSERALKTLASLSEVSEEKWKKYSKREEEYKYTEDLVKDVIKKYGKMPSKYMDFEFTFFHITTSANECRTIQKYGLLNLKQVYQCRESELRVFLDKNGVYFDLENQLLIYNNKKYDISYYTRAPLHNTPEYSCWLIGRRFYFDYATCGFLSVQKNLPYGGRVQYNPEIILNIDKVLKSNLSEEWERTHSPYEVVAKISGDKVMPYGENDETDIDKVLRYLRIAYNTAFKSSEEHILLTKDNVQILPSEIIAIKPLSYWM